MADLKQIKVGDTTYNIEPYTAYLPLTGGSLTGELKLYASSGDSPRLTFQRGELTDTYNDWSIYDSGGYLYIQQRGSGSTAWETRGIFYTYGVDFAGTIYEDGTSLSNKYAAKSHTHEVSDITDIYKQEYNLGHYDTITENSDGSYTITRQTGYLTINAEDITSGTGSSVNSGAKAYCFSDLTDKLANIFGEFGNTIGISSNGYRVRKVDSYWVDANGIGIINNQFSIGFSSEKTQAEIQAMCPITIQYKLATPITEKVEKNHYARYNQKFILDHNKSEAEISSNLFDINTVTIGFGYGYTETATDWVKAIDIPVKPNTTYTSSHPIARYAFNHGDIVVDYNKNTITTGNDTTTLSLFMYVGDYSGTVNAWFSNYMLNEGSVALSYQPYNQNKHITNNEAEFLKTEYDRSANLFNNQYNYSGTNNGVSISVVGNECVLNGTSTNGFYQTLGSVTLKAGTYTFNHVILSGSINGNISQVRFGLHKGGSELFPLGETTGTYTLTEDTSVDIVVWFGTSGMTFNNCKLTFMLNKGSKPLPYQPYEGKVIHKKDITDLYENAYNLGYYDTLIDNDDGTYTITRQTGYLKLDGVKYKFNRIFSSGERGLFSFELTNLNISKPANNGIVGDIICNRFGTYSVNYLRNNRKYGIGIDDWGGIVVCLTKSISTLDDANAYLVKNPISIQYKLPTNETSYIYKNLSKNGRIYPNQYNVNKTYKSELTENGYKLTFTASATEGNPSWDAFLVDFDKTEKYESLTVRFEVIKSDVPLNYCLFQFNDWGESEAENTDALIQHYFSIGNRTGIITETFTVNKDLTKGLGSIGFGFDRTPGAGNVEILIKEISLNKKNGSSSYIATPEKVEESHFARYNERFILDHNKSEAERSANLYSGVQICSGSDTKTYFDARINFFNNSTLISTIWFNKQIKTAYTLVTFTFTKPTNANRMKFGHGGSTKDVEIDYDISNLPNGNYSLSFVVMDNNGTQSFNKIMLNEGTIALPYQPYEGKVVHEKDLESITPGIYKKVATGQRSYSLAYGKTYKIKMNSDTTDSDVGDYLYVNDTTIKVYGTFDIKHCSRRYIASSGGGAIEIPLYEYNYYIGGIKYTTSSAKTIHGFTNNYETTTMTLKSYLGTFDVYELL